jgi:translation initiation factor 2 alpha subunit (eIF-2alpha)
MFFYKCNLPKKGSIVVVTIDRSFESENCVYVTLPEFNNFRGIFYKSELPNRIKHHKKATKDMKQADYIVCTVTNNTKFRDDGCPDLIDLSIKGVDQKHHEKVIARFKNIERIVKLVKFISVHTKIPYDELSKNLKEVIKPISNVDDGSTDSTESETDKNKVFNDFAETYLNYLRKPETLIDILDIDSKKMDYILEVLKERIHENNATSTLEIDIAVWSPDKDGHDPVYVLRELFKYVINEMKEHKLEIRYVGAPRYQLTLPDIEMDKAEDIYKKIQSEMLNYFKLCGVNGFDLKVDFSNKIVSRGSINITYPFEINIYESITTD